jgi:hypothetical protein
MKRMSSGASKATMRPSPNRGEGAGGRAEKHLALLLLRVAIGLLQREQPVRMIASTL